MIKKAQFLTSVADIGRYLDLSKQGKGEIVLLGRSNVGKSTLINFICNNNKLAKTSQQAGKTRLINIFSINDDKFWLVDLPGYGFAADSKEGRKRWSALTEQYLTTSKNIKLALFLLDSRREPSELDHLMLDFLYRNSISFKAVITKCDKLSRMQLNKRLGEISASLGLGIDNLIPVSSTDRMGRVSIMNVIIPLV